MSASNRRPHFIQRLRAVHPGSPFISHREVFTMVRRSAPAAVHVVTIRDQRFLLTNSIFLRLIQLVMRFDVVFQHHPLEAVFTVFSYRGVKDTVVIIITGVCPMSPPAFSQPGGRLSDISLPVTTASGTIYYPVHNLFNIKPKRHDIPIRGEIFGRVGHGNPGYPHPRLRVLIVSEAVQPFEHFFR